VKGPWRASQQKEENMNRLILSHELHTRNERELSALFSKVSQGLVLTKAGTPERRNALASLENIARARRARLMEMRL
jgi:hypothetical protein